MAAARDAGYAALQNGDLGEAIAQLEQAGAADPNDFQTCLYLGTAYGQAERHMDAVTVLTKAVTLQPANAQARYNLAVALESAGYKEQAITAAQQAVHLQSDYIKAQEMVARLTGTPMSPPAYTPPAAPQYGEPASSPSYGQPSDYGQSPQPPAYGQPSPPSYGQPMPPQAPYGQPQQAPYGQPPQQTYGQPPQAPYGQPPQTYGQPLYPPSYGQPMPPQPYGAPPSGSPYQPQGAATYGGPPIGLQPQPYGAVPMFQTEAPDASTALILSILGICLCWLLSPIGLIYALKARKQIEQNPHLTGGGKATAAMVVSIIGTTLLVGIIILFCIGMALPDTPH